MEAVEHAKGPTTLDHIRNTWEFANLAQYIFTFGRAVKIDENLDIEDLEMECLKHQSTVLPEIGLALLKFVSSHRGLTPEIFDEYTRRQYVAKAPERNPFGVEEEPAHFNEFDIFTKLRVLQQLTVWTMGNPDRIRERMEEQKDSEQTIWRIEPFGWDSDDRTYFVLDDNRLYRRTDPPPPPRPAARPKKNSKKAKAAARASKRRKFSEPMESEAEPMSDADAEEHAADDGSRGFGGMKWECIAVTLDDFNTFLSSIEKSRDPNEKILRKRVVDDLLPLLEKQEEARKRKTAQKERELLNLEKLAGAKRSSRIAGRMEHQKQEEEAREAERKHQADLWMAKKEQEKWNKLEKERESRMMTREQRLKEREARRILHEEELANLSEDGKKIDNGIGRLSERHLKAEIEKKKQALEELGEEEEDWIFDCICGAYGQIDDGTHSIACEKCNIWQHSKCVGVSEAEADREDFHFTCTTCQRRAADAERAKTQPPIKIKINRPGSSSSPPTPKQGTTPAVILPALANGAAHTHKNPQTTPPKASDGEKPPIRPMQKITPHMATWQTGQAHSLQGPHHPPSQSSAASTIQQSNGHQMSPQHVSYGSSGASMATPGQGLPPTGHPKHQANQGNTGTITSPQHAAPRPSSAHAFSSPQPNSPTILPPPPQSHPYTFINGNGPRYSNGAQNQHSTSTHHRQGSSELSTGPYGAPVSGATSEQHPRSDEKHRRTSINLSSPLVGAPVLAPPVEIKPAGNLSSSSPGPQKTPDMHTWQPLKSSPPQTLASPSRTLPGQQRQDSSPSSALPLAASGMSPTKHSPPRPTASNGNMITTRPSILPPVATLSPSHPTQNLSPPVKSSPNGHSQALPPT